MNPKLALNEVVAHLVKSYSTNREDAYALFIAIREGYNSLNGYQIANPYQTELTTALKNLNAYGKKFTPQESLELNEALRQVLCEHADKLQAQYNFEEHRIRRATMFEKVQHAYTDFFPVRSHSNHAWSNFFSPSSSFNIINIGSNNATYHSNRSSRDEKDKNSITAILFAILMLTLVVASGIISGLYSLNKSRKSFMNVVNNTKVMRSLFRLTGMVVGTYVGFATGIVIGASLGSTIPGIGTIVGGAIGAVFCAGLGAGFGTLVTKYLAKFISWMQHGQTNPEKWTVSNAEDDRLLDHGFNRDSIDNQITTIMKAIKTRKQKSGADAEEKTQLNHLLHMLKRGEIEGDFKVDNTIYELAAPAKSLAKHSVFNTWHPSPPPAFAFNSSSTPKMATY